MATLTVRHAKVSAVADSADTNLIQPSDWNDDHGATLSGLVAADISDSTTVGRDVLTAANAAAARTAVGAAASGATTSSGLTMATARLLGRSTASTGAIEEITLGTNLSFSGTTLNATGGGGGSGSITASGYTQNTARILGRTTASSGAIEEITIGSGLSLSAGSLTATGGSSSLTLIESWTSAGGETSKTFSNLGSYKDLIVTFNGRWSNMTNNLRCWFNADETSTNYVSQLWNVIAETRTNFGPILAAGSGGTAPSSPYAFSGELTIFQYGNTSFYKNALGRSTQNRNVPDALQGFLNHIWLSTSAITSLLVKGAAGTETFTANSIITVYGRG